MKSKSLAVKRGDCIHQEEPFVFVLMGKYRTTRCDNCLAVGKLQCCSKCMYVQYCNQKCQKEAWPMHKIECDSLHKVAPRIVPDAARIMARIILKLQNGGDLEKGYYTDRCYRRFRDLMSHYKEIRGDRHRMEHLETLTVVLEQLLGHTLMPNSSELLGIYGRLVVNGFNILDPEMNPVATGIYLGVSVVDHCCTPNAVATFEGKKLSFRALTDMPCMDWSKTFISYIDTMNTTEERRNDLKAHYYFHCICTRCVDDVEPLEMNSAACPSTSCHQQLNFSDTTTDKCPSCGTQITREHIAKYNEVVEFTKMKLQEMKNVGYLDVCSIMLKRQEGVLHKENVWHVKTLDLAFESAINIEKWDDALNFGRRLLPGFKKYNGEYDPILGHHYLKVAKIELLHNMMSEAQKHLQLAKNIIRVTHGEKHSVYRDHVIKLAEETKRYNVM